MCLWRARTTNRNRRLTHKGGRDSHTAVFTGQDSRAGDAHTAVFTGQVAHAAAFTGHAAYSGDACARHTHPRSS